MEESGRGRVWFWQSVTRFWFAMLGRDLMTAPVAMAVASAAAWFVYMLPTLTLAATGYVVVTLAWGVACVLANHTGIELLTDLLKIRLDWPPLPTAATYVIQAVTGVALAPFLIGRCSALHWRGHEVSLAVVMLIVWSAMAALVPLVGVGIRVRPVMVPLMVRFVLGGSRFERFRSVASGNVTQ